MKIEDKIAEYKFKEYEIVEEIRCSKIIYGKFEFVIQKKSDGFYDICIYHKDFEGELQRNEIYSNFEEARRYIISEFIHGQLQ